MSAKLQSIPKETIQVAPKEVVLSTNGFISLEDSLKPLEIPQIDDLPSDNSSQDLSLELKEESEIPVDITNDTEQKEVKEEVEDQIEVDEHVKDSNFEQNEVNGEVIPDQIEKPENDCEHVQVPVQVDSPESPVQDTPASPEINEKKETSDSSEPPVQDDSIEEPSKPVEEEKCSPVQAEICDDPEDDFGDFAEVPPLQLDDDNDSDFGDFEEETTKDEFASASGWASLDTSPRGKLDQILIGLQLKLSSVISTLFSVVLADNSSPEEIFDSDIPMLDLAKEDCQDDSVWMQIHNIQSTPALNQKWKDTLSRQRLLNLLNIDPKYVVSLVNNVSKSLILQSRKKDHFLRQSGCSNKFRISFQFDKLF